MKVRLIVFFVCMLLVGSFFPVSSIIINDEYPLNLENGNTLYVGGSGPGNYSRIQNAINDANDGDTVFVYNGTYYENLTINKEIKLFGKDRETTIIDGLKLTYNIISIEADRVTISGFTIKDCIDTGYGGYGIKIKGGDYINIVDNIISTNDEPYGVSTGIYDHHRPLGHKYITINNNIFINNEFGILVHHTPFINISYNEFRDNKDGIGCLYRCPSAIIRGNLIDGFRYHGIIIDSKYCIVSKNTISNQTWIDSRSLAGILVMETNNQIINNNFINNKRNAVCETLPWLNKWDGNYWDNWIGFKYPQFDFLPYLDRYIFWFVIDWNPAFEPFDIGIT